MGRTILICLCLMCGGCKTFNIQRQIGQFIGSNIEFPVEMELFPNDNGFIDSIPKLVIYTDSEMCTLCNIKKISIDVDSLKGFNLPIEIIPIIAPQVDSIVNLHMILKYYMNRNPVFLDEECKFRKVNSLLPVSNRFHTFLLDKNNKVVLVGNPLASDAMWNLFRKTLDNMLAHDGVYVPDK